MERQLNQHEREQDLRYCRQCDIELKENERYICDRCEENNTCTNDENLEL